MDQEFLCLSSSLFPNKLRILLPCSAPSGKGAVDARSPLLSREWCFLPALWVRGTFSGSISCCSSFGGGRKPVLGASGVQASCQTVFAEPARKGKLLQFISAKIEWDFMRQRKGTSPLAGLLTKGLLHT